ncbi:MAG TPA: hypothetical protein VE135_11620 [Pyrinomonadaceae bacterium]|nr:hypothetical protein [Pyrinomonadaceae bacterium]
MFKQLSLMLCILFALVLVGCNKEGTEKNANSTAGTKPPAMAASPMAAMSPGTMAEKIGVPECDDFITKYDACITGHVPEAARAQYKTSIEQWRSSWHKLAANPQTKATLAAACKTAAEQARTSMKTYNCTF